MHDKHLNKHYLSEIGRLFESETDPDGWYTGVPTDGKYEEPIQDADDL